MPLIWALFYFECYLLALELIVFANFIQIVK